MFCDEKPPIDETQLRNLLDAREAKHVMLSLDTYYKVVRRIVTNADGKSRISVVLMDKNNRCPVGLATFIQKRDSLLDEIVPLPGGEEIMEELAESPRKVFYELEYCIRGSKWKGHSVGDVLLSCGFEYIARLEHKRPVSVIVYMVLAGSFTNIPALSLYSKYRISVVGVCDNRLTIMALCDVKSHVQRAYDVMRRSLEATYLLPRLKERYLKEGRTSNAEGINELTTNAEIDDSVNGSQLHHSQTDPLSQASTASSNESASSSAIPSGSDLSQRSNETSQEAPRANAAVMRPTVAENQGEWEEKLRNLEFRTYVDHLKWSSNIVYSLADGSMVQMKQNLSLMVRRAARVERYSSVFQHIEMGRQIEAYAAKVNKNSSSVLDELSGHLGDVDYNPRYLRKIVQYMWAIHRYNFLEMACLTWKECKSMLIFYIDLLSACACHISFCISKHIL